MSEVVQQEVAATETAPAVPTEAPPAIEEPQVAAPVTEEAAPAEAAAAAAAPVEEKKEKKSGSVARRFTFTKKWGKHRDAEPAAPKEPEEAKDPKDDVLGWIAQQIPAAVHKANYKILDWVQTTAIPNEEERKPIPGKDQATTRNQFLGFLRENDILVKLANSLQAGAIEPAVAEENADAAAQKEVQKKNIESFAQWASTATGVENVLSSDDILEKGKAGYSAVFQTLWSLGLQAKEKFDKDGFDVESIKAIAATVVKSGLLTTILGFFRRNRQASVEEPKEGENADAAAGAAQEGENAEGAAAPEAAAAETVDEPVAVKVETNTPAAVAAN